MVFICKICHQRVLRHSPHLNCFACKQYLHFRCLLNVCISDSIYADRDTNNWLCTLCAQNELPFNHYDENNDFLRAVLEMQSPSASISSLYSNLMLSDANNIEFNPFDLNDDVMNTESYDIDPDLQYFNDSTYLHNVNNCNYFLEETFNKKSQDLSIDENCFSFMQINIRSIPKNLNKLVNLLQMINIHFSVIGISETWLKDHNATCYTVPGYKHYYNHRRHKTGGGVSTFVLENIPVIERKELALMENFIECLFIEIPREVIRFKKNLIIGMIYRPPNQDISNFTDKLEFIISKIGKENKLLYLMGDFNINLLNCDNHVASAEFIECLYSHSLFPLITKPSRITRDTTTLIDNIFFNDISRDHLFNGLLMTGISDHLPIFTVVTNTKVVYNFNSRISRMISPKNVGRIKNVLVTVDWSDITCNRNGREAFTQFIDIFNRIYNSCFPIVVKKNNYCNRKL